MFVQTDKYIEKINDQVNQGFIFKSNAEHCARNLIEIASRTFIQIEIENKLLKQYEIKPSICFTDAKVAQIQDWLYQRCQIQSGDTFTLILRRLAYELMLPTGLIVVFYCG